MAGLPPARDSLGLPPSCRRTEDAAKPPTASCKIGEPARDALSDSSARRILLSGSSSPSGSSSGRAAPSTSVPAALAASLERERAAGAQLESALSVIDECEGVAAATAGELGRNRDTLTKIHKGVQDVDAEATEAREVARRMQRRTGFTGMFVQMYEAVTGK